MEDGNILIEISYDEKEYLKAKITSSEYIDTGKYEILQKVINRIKNEEFAKKNNLDLAEVEKINEGVTIERVITKLDKSTYEKYSGIFLIGSMLIYMLFIFISSSLASTIGMEKVSKTTEYMLTGISENSYLWYNILQTNIVVILQTALSAVYMIIAGIINTVLKVSFLGASITLDGTLISNISLNVEGIVIWSFVILIVQAIISIVILSIIQAVLSSRVNNISDVSNSTVIVLFFVIFATVIFPNFIPTGESVNIFLKIVSTIPVISVVAIPKLLLLGQISKLWAIISIVISLGFTVILSIFGSKAFKKGLLSTSRGSKREERVEKANMNDFNAYKLKGSMAKVAISFLIYLIVSNLLGFITKLAFSEVKGVFNYIVQILTWIFSIYPSYAYLKGSLPTSKEKVEVKKLGMLKYIFMGFGVVWAIQLIAENLSSSSTNIIELIKFDYSSPICIILLFVYLALLPAIFEELLFRKAIYGILKRYGVKLAIIISSLAFALMHQNAQQAIFAFFVGIVFCFIDVKAGSIFPSIVLHFINNSIAALQLVISNVYEAELASVIINNLSIVFIVIMIIALVFLVVNIIYSKIKKKEIKIIAENVSPEFKVLNPVKVVLTDFITDLTLGIYVIITVCMSILLK